ncbi:MAG: BTAD domain-containing putative transcriptional regulator [Actinomycetota bacterium]
MSTGSPSSTTRGLIDRPRLVARLAARFTHRVVTVVGNGGTGKTTLVQQAIDAEPREFDVVHGCSAADADAGHLLSAVLRSLDDTGRSRAGTLDDAIAHEVLARSPRHVAVILDDTHLLPDGEAIERLLAVLPENGHLVLVGRRPPPIELGRLDSAGRLAEIVQADLLMTLDEQIAFANQRGVAIDLLAGAEGWPAFIELAASGSEVRSRRYLEEEALRSIAPERRHALAVFAFVRGGDDAIARAATGGGLDELIADLPLVRWDGDDARLHDLWAELLVDELGATDRTAAALAAAAVHRERGEFDRAIELARSVDEWDDLATTLATAVREGVDGGLGVDQLDRWRRLAPAERTDDPIVVLLDGLIAREADPTTPHTRELLGRAAEGFAAAGEPELELAALLQLGYVVRIVGEVAPIDEVMARIEALARHHPPARPYLAFGEAWTALAQGRPDLQLAAMERITDVDLPPVWAKSRDHYLAHALFNLGRPQEALEHARRLRAHDAVAIPGSLTTELQCLWYAGHPDEALRRSAEGLSAGHGARDRFIAGAWRAAMCAFAGDVAGARTALEVAHAHQGDQPGLLTAAQTILVEGVIDIAENHEEAAQDRFRAALEFAPLGNGISEQTLRNLLPTPYVLLPETRTFWDEYAVGPSIVAIRRAAQAFVAAREDGDRGLLGTIPWPDVPTLAATFPVRLAMQLAIHGVLAGRHEGRHLAAWLCEHWGEPAVRALREHVDDPLLGAAARELVASTPAPPRTAVRIGALGPASVWHDDRPTADPHWRRERVRALLVALILKPDTTREQLAGTLWPDHSMTAAAKNLRTTLNYLHAVLEPHRASGEATWCVQVDGSTVRLNPRLDVDVWRFRGLLDEADEAERRGRPDEALPLLHRALDLWRGDLAEDLELELLDLERIHLRSRFVRASCRVTELLTATGRPDEAIETARPALEIDRWHEPTYLALADAYTAVGDHTSARAVLDRGAANLGVPLTGRGAAPLRP